MAIDYNDNAPSTLGLEWNLTGGHLSGVQRSPIRGLRFSSTAAVASIDDLQFRIDDTGLTGPEYRALLELFVEGNELVDQAASPVQTFIGRPSADDGANSNIAAGQWNGVNPPDDVTDLWAYINEPVVWPPPSGFIDDSIIQQSTVNRPYCFWLDTSGFPSTARVLRVRSRAVGYAFTLGGVYSNRPFGFRLLYRPTGAIFTPPGGSGALASLYTTLFEHDYGEINPVTGLPWTPADIQAFDGGNWVARITSFANTGADTAPVLISYELLVDYITTENRVAVGSWARPAVQANALVTTDALATYPGGTAGWAKANATRYVAGLRIAYDTLSYPNAPSTAGTKVMCADARLNPGDPVEAPPNSGISADVFTLDSLGLYRSAAGDDSRIPGFIMRDGATVDGDSQVYVVDPDVNPTFAVTSGDTWGQRFTPGANANYITVAFPISYDTPGTPSTLTFQIRRVSDNVQMGGQFQITDVDFLALPTVEAGGNMRFVTGAMSAGAALVSGTQYEMRLSTNAGTWRIAGARAIAGEAGSFGGTAGVAVRDGGSSPVTIVGWDLPITINLQPDGILNPTATVLAVPTRYGVNCFCDADAYEVVNIRWQQPAVPGFDRMTIERMLDDGSLSPAWELVATMPYDSDSWADREVPRGIAARYRLINFVAGGGFSVPAETGWATPAARGCHLIFTSNDAPDMTVVYGFEPHVDFHMLDFEADQLLPVDGADFYIVLREAERRGIGFTARLIVNFARVPCDDTGRQMGMQALFEPARAAARWPNVEYVCVLDHVGNRTFAHVSLGRATKDDPGNRYYVDATITPLTATAIPVDLR